MLIALCAASVKAFGVAPAATEHLAADGPHRVTLDRRIDLAATTSGRAMQSAMLATALAGSRIVAAGERGMILHSDDCGASWQQAKVPVAVTLTALHFVDEKQGWAIGHGGVVLVTHDGGSTWLKQLDGRMIAEIAQAAALRRMATAPSTEAQRALGEAERLTADGPDKPLFAMHFWSKERGIIVGAYGLALLTEDAGTHWQWIAERIPNPKGLHLYGMWGDENQIFLVGEQGLVVRSNDGARHFQSVATPYAGSYFGVAGFHRDNKPEIIIYGLRGHAFRISTLANSIEPLSLGVQASLLNVSPRQNGNLLIFDADGRVIEMQSAQKSVTLIGSSPVGPVLNTASACGKGIVIAGMRGLAIIDPDSMADSSKKGTSK